MNEENQLRLTLARQIAPGYTNNPKVAVLVVAGSVGRSNADMYSDIELDVYWHESPTDEDRMAPIVGAGGNVEIFWDYSAEEEEWGEEYVVNGMKIGISSFLTSSIDRWLIDVTEQGDPNELKQMRLAAIQHCIPLCGEPQVRAWQNVAQNYPNVLVHTVITRYVEDEAFHGWYGRRMLAARDDCIMLYDICCRVEKCIVGMLLGLNRIYLANPAFKWMDATIAQMALAPADLSARLKHVFHCTPVESVAMLEALLDETVALLETHVASLDLTDFKTRLHRQRGSFS
jgi:hypothetical protein